MASYRSIDPAIAKTERRTAVLAVVVAVGLMGLKFVAYGLTGSSAIFSDALESIVNVLAGMFALYAVILAHRPADDDHPYGHGKIEFLAAGFEGGMILLAAMVIAWRGIEGLIYGQTLQRIDKGMLLIVIATVINAAVGLMLLRAGKKNGSLTLEADGKHLLGDAVTSVAVFAALLVVKFTGYAAADGICAVVVAVYLVWVSIDLLKRSAAGLMDAQDAKDDAMLRQILDSHLAPGGAPPLVCSYHALRHRHTGRYHWVDFHLVVPASLDVKCGHEIASVIEGEIEQSLGIGDATAHVEPCVSATCLRCAKSPAAAAGIIANVPAVSR